MSSRNTTSRSDPASTEDSAIASLVGRIIDAGSQSRASDIHIEPRHDAVHVRFRIDGSLVDIDRLALSSHGALVSRLKIMAGMNIVERRRPQDGQFSTVCRDRALDIRLATLSTIHGEKIALRLLDQVRTTRGLSELGMTEDVSSRYRHLIGSPFGLVLCCGPTGSGKTTTLYASLLDMDIEDRNVTTIEDPVEYIVPGINQVRTNDQAGLTFASGLRALLRQDPDIILIGELRDEETARLGVQAALTGHVVLSSMHATNAAGALQRLVDMGVEPFLLSSCLVGIVGQRLLRRICPSCRDTYTPLADEIALCRRLRPDMVVPFQRGSGCSLCSHTGFLERVGVYEVLHISPDIRRLVVHNADTETIQRRAVREGMRTMHDAAMDLVEAGITTVDEVVRSLGTVTSWNRERITS